MAYDSPWNNMFLSAGEAIENFFERKKFFTDGKPMRLAQWNLSKQAKSQAFQSLQFSNLNMWS